MSPASGKYLLQSVASMLSLGVHVALAVALIIVAVSTVARHRPDASQPFLFAGVVDLAGTLVHWLLAMVGPRFVPVDGISTFFGATTLLGTCFTIGWGALLLVGLARIARPPPDPNLPPMPPYR